MEVENGRFNYRVIIDMLIKKLNTSGALTADGNVTLGNGIPDRLSFLGEILQGTPLTFEGATDNNIYTIFQITDPTVANKTITFPDASGTVNLSPAALAADLALSSDAGGQIVVAADAQPFSINSDAINLGNTATDVITVTGGILFDELTNDLDLSVTDQSAPTGSLIIPDLAGTVQTIATLNDISNDFIIDGNDNTHSSNISSFPLGSSNVIFGFNAALTAIAGSDNILIGRNTDVTDATDDNIALGFGSTVSGGQAVAIGFTSVGSAANAIAIGNAAQATASDAVAIGAGTVANVANTIVLGDGVGSNFNVGVGVQNVQIPLQIGNNLGMAHFQNATNVIDGEFVGNNLYPDYTNAIDNELRRQNGNLSSFVFFDDGNISLIRITGGAANSIVNLSTDVHTWVDLNTDGSINLSGADGDLPTNPGSDIVLQAGDGNTTGNGGNIFLTGGGTGGGNEGRIVSMGDLVVATDGATPRRLVLEDADAAESLTISAPNNLTGNLNWILPIDNGLGGQVLANDGGGTLTWANSGLTLPFSDLAQSTAPASFEIQNDTGPAARFLHASDLTALEIAGDIGFLAGVDRNIGVGPSTGAGNALSIFGGDAGGAGPDDGGDVALIGGTGIGGGNGGNIVLNVGANGGGVDGTVFSTGDFIFFEGAPRTIGVATNTSAAGDPLDLFAGNASAGIGGDLTLSAGLGNGGAHGNVVLIPGL